MSHEDNNYTDKMKDKFSEKLPQTCVPYHNAVGMLIKRFHETGYFG